MFDDKTKTEIVENIVHEVNRAYDEGYNDGSKIASKTKKEKSYEEGLQDAWNAARKLLSSTNTYIKRLQFTNDINLTAAEVICDYNVFDVIKKIKEEANNSKVIKIGDEVVITTRSGEVIEMYVMFIYNSIYNTFYTGITNKGTVIYNIEPMQIYRTGNTNYKLREALEDIYGES